MSKRSALPQSVAYSEPRAYFRGNYLLFLGSSAVLVGRSTAPFARLANAAGSSAVTYRCQLEWIVVAGDIPRAGAGPRRRGRRRYKTRPALGDAGGVCGGVYGSGGGEWLRVYSDAFLVCVDWA